MPIVIGTFMFRPIGHTARTAMRGKFSYYGLVFVYSLKLKMRYLK